MSLLSIKAQSCTNSDARKLKLLYHIFSMILLMGFMNIMFNLSCKKKTIEGVNSFLLMFVYFKFYFLQSKSKYTVSINMFV